MTSPAAAPAATGATFAQPLATRWYDLVVAGLSGLVLSFGFPGWDVNLLAWVALVPLCLYMLAARTWRAYALLAASFSFGFFGGLNYWLLAMHPLTWISPEITVPISIGIVTLAWGGLALVMATWATAFLTFLGPLAQRLAGAGRLSATSFMALAVGLWVAMELFQASGTFGYPWGLLALSQYKALPLLQMLAWVGPFPLSGLIVAANAAIAWGLARREWKPAAAVAALVVLVSLGGGLWMNQKPAGPEVTVAAVQGNISQTEKWTPGREFQIADTYLALSEQASGSDLVVWPESALPILLERHALFQRLSSEARARRTVLLTGTFAMRDDGKGQRQFFNSTTAFDPDGFNLGWDAKKHLVPFGEYLPWRHTLPPIWAKTFGALNMLSEDVTPGDRPRPFRTRFGAVGTNVCFDSIFPDVLRATTRQGATMLVLVTNDGWYKRTMALQQHLAHGVLRAVENRRPFIQAANTGQSAVIDHTGRILAMAPTWQGAVARAAVTPVSGWTPYTRFGDWLAYLLVALGALAGLLGWKGRKTVA